MMPFIYKPQFRSLSYNLANRAAIERFFNNDVYHDIVAPITGITAVFNSAVISWQGALPNTIGFYKNASFPVSQVVDMAVAGYPYVFFPVVDLFTGSLGLSILLSDTNYPLSMKIFFIYYAVRSL